MPEYPACGEGGKEGSRCCHLKSHLGESFLPFTVGRRGGRARALSPLNGPNGVSRRRRRLEVISTLRALSATCGRRRVDGPGRKRGAATAQVLRHGGGATAHLPSVSELQSLRKHRRRRQPLRICPAKAERKYPPFYIVMAQMHEVCSPSPSFVPLSSVKCRQCFTKTKTVAPFS